MELKDYILKNMDQIKIFSEYLHISESDISDSINYKIKLKSYTRPDEDDDSLSFKYYRDKLICRDFGDISFSGDIFKIVGIIINKNCNVKSEFIDICKHIINNVGVEKKVKKQDKTLLIEDPTTITFTSRPFNNNDFKYFRKYSIDSSIVMDNYYAVRTYRINNIGSTYFHNSIDPCYAYINNPDCLKLYFPLRPKTRKRFISNNKIPIELIHTIRRVKHTVLIKAFKDKLLMDKVCNILNIRDIQFLPVSSESARLPEDIIRFIRSYTDGDIYTMFDLDKCGIESSFIYRNSYGFKNIFLGENYATKDPTDLVNSIKLESFVKLFFNVYKTF